MTPEDIRDLIRDELDRDGELDLWDVTRKVVAHVPDSELRSVLEFVMRPYVSQFVGVNRRAVLADIQAPEFLHESPVPAAPRRPGPSKRSVMTAAWRTRFEATPVPVPGRPGRPKRYGECTIADLEKIRADSLSRAQANIAQADWCERVIGIMRAAGASTIHDLPDDALQPLVQAHAA